MFVPSCPRRPRENLHVSLPRKQAGGSATSGAYSAIVNELTTERGVTVTPGWGAGNLVLKVDGKIFVILSSNGFVAKLPKTRVDELVARGAGTRFDPRKNGRVMKEWIVVSEEASWAPLAREALDFGR